MKRLVETPYHAQPRLLVLCAHNQGHVDESSYAHCSVVLSGPGELRSLTVGQACRSQGAGLALQ